MSHFDNERRNEPLMRTVRRRTFLPVAMLLASSSSLGGDVLLHEGRAGYGVTRHGGDACFAIAPSWLAPQRSQLSALRPGVFRHAVVVEAVYKEGFSIVRIGEDAGLCGDAAWDDGAGLDARLAKTELALLQAGVDDAAPMHVRIERIDADGFFTIAPVRRSDKLVGAMSGRRVLLDDSYAGVLLEVDEMKNRGRVIRQDFLTLLTKPFFSSRQPGSATRAVPPDTAGPVIKQRYFIGKQTWRNNPKIVGSRIFVGSSGYTRGQADPLDGVYSFDMATGQRAWFVPTDGDFNDLTYIKGLVIGGTESGQVLGVGARSGKTYWTRQMSAAVSAQPVRVRNFVAVATADGSLVLLALKDGASKLTSEVDGPVRAGLAAGRGDLWVATESGKLYRYVSFGEVQMRRDSNVYYPDAMGNPLSGSALAWYQRLGEGRGLRASLYAPPLVLEDKVIVTLAREDQYAYPPVMAFHKNGQLAWIGTDPKKLAGDNFGDSYLKPAAWYDRLILADPDSNSIYSISRETGEIVWAQTLGNENFQLWSSPVVADDHVYIATYDGFLHKFDAIDGRRLWSMYLGHDDLAGETFLAGQPLPDVRMNPAWRASNSGPVFSTPAVSGNTIVIGNDQGYLYVIEDRE